MDTKFDVIVIGSGPGGYVTAIRAAQLGMKTAVVERENLGGVCLNWGCIPTKALLKSAQVYEYLLEADKYGVEAKSVSYNFDKMIDRSRGVANGMAKGIEFLMKKNKITVIRGEAKVLPGKSVEVEGENKGLYMANHIIIATGTRSRELPNIPQDGERIIGYRQAMTLKTQPKRMVVVGSGAIGVEFAQFYHSIGTEVTIVEFMPQLVPNEDKDVAKQLEKSFKKKGMHIMTNSSVEQVDTSSKDLKVHIKTAKGNEVIECDVVLSAVGVKSNIENIGLETVGIKTEKDKVIVDEYYKTSKEGYYAIGDIVPGPALAHVASAEGITCVEAIAGLNPDTIDYSNIPGCTYCSPEIASVGLTEEKAKAEGYELKVGTFPFSASGKAQAGGHADGFVKVIFDAKYGEWLGCHMIGANVTEMITEAVVARKLETTGHEILKTVHPHPTMSEAVMEATHVAYGEAIHI